MSNKGLDTAQDLSAHGQQLVDGGFTYVCRYTFSVAHSSKDKLTHSEAVHLSRMGIYLVNVFENDPTKPEYFSYSKGVSDGTAAFDYAFGVLGQPKGTPIYFTVDYDATEHDLQTHIIPYFKGLRTPKYGYLLGVYGSGLVCRRLLEEGLVSFTWLAQSTGWAEYREYEQSGKWNLRQLWSTSWHGIDVDTDISNGNGGGWKLS